MITDPQRYSVRFFRAKDNDGAFVLGSDYERLRDQYTEVYEALKTFWSLFEGPPGSSFIISPATKRLMTNGEQDRIDAALLKVEAALRDSKESTDAD